MGGVGVWQLLIVGVLIILLFGTKKLGTLGSDLGESIKGFKKAMRDDVRPANEASEEDLSRKSLTYNANGDGSPKDPQIK
ncbi:twin-arginine translocase TatA/TatE family subunit [Yersinia frederiksenii]|uniref:twin-arginine translocase TatA/TatE family subunit n=1 Tax=Yersinia frederiksenii TaxID=29484 RepID=UPI0005DD068C|nr:twin-arginine translocase TatA/TatE family subunit [Yersinia frederiksenii]CNF45251.1 Sec-independent protein translocase protein TatA [Yersinia frederiksenii]